LLVRLSSGAIRLRSTSGSFFFDPGECQRAFGALHAVGGDLVAILHAHLVRRVGDDDRLALAIAPLVRIRHGLRTVQRFAATEQQCTKGDDADCRCLHGRFLHEVVIPMQTGAGTSLIQREPPGKKLYAS